MFIIAGQFEVDASRLNDVRQQIYDVEQRTRSEDGCLFYAIALDDESAARFVIIEKWKDEKSLQAHLARPAMTQFVEKLRSAVTRIELKVYDIAGERDFQP